MAVDQAFIARVSELFAFLPELRTRRMFGGLGVYAGDVFFAVADDGEVYLKVDGETKGRFEAEGLPAFAPEMNGVPTPMGYHRLPEAAWDDEEVAREWTRLAIDAALRAKAGKGKRRK